MNCYLCQHNPGESSRPAVGICQRCGAGICESHLIEVTRKPVGGMMAMTGLRRLLCMVCAQEHGSSEPQRPERVRQKESSSWWQQWFGNRNRSTLPTPEEAIAEAERVLKQERPPQKGNTGV
jgi:hypothetical protein